MKKIALMLLSVILFASLPACQQKSTDEDAGKIQESIEKIKTKLQENLGSKPDNSDKTDKSDTITPDSSE